MTLTPEWIDRIGGGLEAAYGRRTPGDVVADSVAYSITESLRLVEGFCESPIEQAMLWALASVGGERFHNVEFKTAGVSYMGLGAPGRFVIEPQALVGHNRADFRLSLITSTGEPAGDLLTQLVVECDGHDFHDRTKEQASRDRARDRRFHSQGLIVYRYTGADIWRDAVGCASEAITAINGLAWKRAAEVLVPA